MIVDQSAMQPCSQAAGLSQAKVGSSGGSAPGSDLPVASAERNWALLQRLPSIALLVSRAGAVVESNGSFERQLGYSRSEILGRPVAILGAQLERALAASRVDPPELAESQSIALQTRSGAQIFCLLSISRWGTVEATMALVCAVECGREHRLDRKLRRLAFLDPLTHLPNRTAFLQRFRSACSALKNGPLNFAVALINLDHFRLVNDTYGYQAGDRVLTLIASRLREAIAEHEFLARLSEDEFALIVSDQGSQAELCERVDQFLSVLTEPHDVGDRKVRLTASAGVVRVRDPSPSANEMLHYSDAALTSAKDGGRNRTTVYEERLHEQSRMRLALYSALRRALRERELEVHMQPIVDAQGSLAGLEALVRWPEGFRGACTPSEFIPASETLGIAPELDRFVVQESARWLAYLRETHPEMRTMPVNINISAVTLRNAAIVGVLRESREQYGLEPRALRVEITETALLSDSEQVTEVLQQLSSTGTPLILDDFGTGYSSLRHLYDLPISGLKIDRYFVNRALRDPRSLALVKAILSLANDLGLETTAEGIETEDQRITLSRLGCRAFQGYLFARSMPPIDLPGWLDRNAVATRAAERANVCCVIGARR